MADTNKYFMKSFIEWEISIAKFSVVIGGILGVVFFVFGNSLGQAVTDDTVGIVEAILYLVRTILALFILGSALNLIFQIFGVVTSLFKNEKVK